ncbi:MAG: hypothetical protein GX638_00255, partial [Crenarchaeota archaeon]|nr:hypothetical protein [Thermoproteota archaeon]
MIKINYEIIRDENDEKVIFTPPSEFKEIPNIALIEGPNSSGKSTILNLIALSFDGIKSTQISKSLRGKMQSLLQNYQELNFSIEIEGQDYKLLFTRDLSSGQQIKIYEIKNDVKKPISTDNLNLKYNLIYDIPDDPVGRLNQLTNTISFNQKNILSQIRRLRDYIRSQIIELSNSKDPKKIERSKNKIEELRSKVENYSNEHEKQLSNCDILEQYYYHKFAKKYLKEINDYSKLINDIKQKEGKTENAQKKIKFNSKNYQKVKRYIDSIENESNQIIHHLVKLFPQELKLLQEWDTYNYSECINTYNFSRGIKAIIEKIDNLLNQKKTKNENIKKEIEKSEFLTTIINVLKNFQTKDITIPGINQNIKDYLKLLEEENSHYKSKADNYNLVDELSQKIKAILKDVDVLQNELLPLLSKEDFQVNSSFEIDENELRKTLNNTLKQYEICKEKYIKYRDECIKKGIDIDNQEIC